MSDPIPDQALGVVNQRWRRWVENAITGLGRRLVKYASDIENTISGLNGSINKLADQITILNAIASIKYAEFSTSITGFTGFYSGTRPSVVVNSPTGRIEVGFGGSANNGSIYFAYSVTAAPSIIVVDRVIVQANPAQRVAVSGGASFAPSGYKTVIVNVPKNTDLTVTLELYTDSSTAIFFGGSVLARVAP